MPKIYLYAEILTHIRQLSLHASLQTAKAEGTKVDVSVDKKVITVVHDGETQKLYLPTQISGTAQVTFPTEKNTEISARVQIDDQHEWKCNISHEIEAPWMAANLTKETAIQCGQCNATILCAGVIDRWKDLPSENWAELMDFWFCHKPHDDEAQSKSASSAAQAKGFSSRSKLAIASGTGMTDLTSIVLHSSDCRNLQTVEHLKTSDTATLRCHQCTSLLGTTNQSENLVRLSKSTIRMSTVESTTSVESYPASVFICAQILSLIEATAFKKFVVHSLSLESESPDNPSEPRQMVIWVFNPDIYYSCSAHDGNSLVSNISHHPKVSPNPHNDDTSQIYSDQEAHAQKEPDLVTPGRKEQSDPADEIQDCTSGSEPLQIRDRHNKPPSENPNHDDISQIYGESAGPKFISGDIELDVPISEVRPKSTAEGLSSSAEPMHDTETPFIKPKKASTGNEHVPHTEPKHSSPQTEHVNLVHRATKIFYKTLPSGETPAKFLDANSTTHEELYLSNPAEFDELYAALGRSNAMLPASAKAFQDWKVGLLDRYEKVPSGLVVMQENPLARGVKVKDGRVTRWSIGDGAEGLYA